MKTKTLLIVALAGKAAALITTAVVWKRRKLKRRYD